MPHRSFTHAGVYLVLLAAASALPQAASADARDEILAAHAALVKVGKFRTIGTADTPQGVQKNTVEVVWPERFHIIGEQVEIIIIPGKTFMKQGGQWQIMPVDMSAAIESFRPQAMKQTFERTTNAKDLGDSTVNGHAVHGYEYDTSATVAGITASSHVKMWVDKASGLPVRQEVDGVAMGHKSHTVNDYQFDAGIKVEAPM